MSRINKYIEAESDCQEPGGIEIERWLLVGPGFVFLGLWDEVLKSDSGDDCPTPWIYWNS